MRLSKECFPKRFETYAAIRLATRVLVVTPVTFMMTKQRTHTICNPKLFAIFPRLEKMANRIAKTRRSFHWIRETVWIEVTVVRPNFHVNISEQFTIRECMRPSLEGSVNRDL